jgi:hypothetical protein
MEHTEFEGEVDMGKAIVNMESPGYDDGLTIIISDFLTESDWKKAIDFLLYRQREVLLIQVLSPDELYPDLDGRLDLNDSENEAYNMRVIMTKKMVEAYQKALDSYEKEIIDFCSARAVTFFTVCSDDPIEKIIFGKGYETEVIK